MNRYKVTVRCDKELIVQAEDEGEAVGVALDSFHDSCLNYTEAREVVKIVNLTGDPIELLTELAMELDRTAFKNPYRVCEYCGGTRASHSATCLIERARYCIREHRRKHEHTD